MKIAIIGCGKQAPKHVSGLKLAGITEFVFYDIYADAAKELSEKFDGEHVDSLDNVFNDSSINAVDICTPVQFHFDLILRAIENKKHFFCEKPLSLSFEEDIRIKKAADKAGVIGMVGYIYRFVPTLVKGKEFVTGAELPGANSQVLGNVHSAIFRVGGRGSHMAWKHLKASGGGALNEMAVHMIDLAYWYFGPISDVKLLEYELRQQQRVINGETVDCDVEDWVLLSMASESGVKILIIADLNTPAFTQSVQVQGTNGSFCGSIEPSFDSYIHLSEERTDFQFGKTSLSNSNANFFVDQMSEFVMAIQNNRVPDRNTISDSVEVMKIVELINKSTG